MPQSTPVPPLFKHAGPPPPLPLLTSQTRIGYDRSRLYNMTAHEEILPVTPLMRHHSVPSTSKSRVRFESLPPNGQLDDTTSQHSESSLSSVPSDSESEASESAASDDSDRESKIPKPPGEAGRPGRGGYTLRVALGWSAQDHKKLSDYVEKKVNECLNPKISYLHQKPSALGVVREAAIEAFPILENYVDCWPVNDMLLARLKITSSNYRKRKRDRDGAKALEEVERLRKKKKEKTAGLS